MLCNKIILVIGDIGDQLVVSRMLHNRPKISEEFILPFALPVPSCNIKDISFDIYCLCFIHI